MAGGRRRRGACTGSVVMLEAAARAANHFVRVLLEPECLACERALHRPLDGAVCPACWGSIASVTPPWCARCGEPLPHAQVDVCTRCARQPPSFLSARSAGRYEGVLRDVVHAFKYGRRRALSRPLGRRLRTAGALILEDADAVVPVPLHPWRRLQRGFNQADDLARELGLPVWRGLARTRHGPPQAALPAARRRANVRAAFRVRSPRLPYRHIVLVDDVMTTGETLEACSRALLEAGVESVRALTVARAAAELPRGRLPPLPQENVPR
jgi:ComF family protein